MKKKFWKKGICFILASGMILQPGLNASVYGTAWEDADMAILAETDAKDEYAAANTVTPAIESVEAETSGPDQSTADAEMPAPDGSSVTKDTGSEIFTDGTVEEEFSDSLPEEEISVFGDSAEETDVFQPEVYSYESEDHVTIEEEKASGNVPLDETGLWGVEIHTGEAYIFRYYGYEEDVTIPEQIAGCPVTYVSPYTFISGYQIFLGRPIYDDQMTVRHLTVPASVIKMDEEICDHMAALEAIDVDSENSIFASIDGLLLSKDLHTLYSYPRAKKDVSYKLPDPITKLSQSSIYRNSFLQYLNLNHVTDFGYASIYDNEALICVDLGDSITEITRTLISMCFNLQEVIFPASLRRAQSVFVSCPSVEKLTVRDGGFLVSEDNILFNKEKTILYHYAPKHSETEYTIPNTVTTICTNAFNWSKNLQTLTLSENVENILYEAFASTGISRINILNPDCCISNDELTFSSEIALAGYQPSTASDYAAYYRRTFINLENESIETNAVTYEDFLRMLPDVPYGEPTFQDTNVIHESDTSRQEYIGLKQFTDSLIADCTTDYEKIQEIVNWVNSHITYRIGTPGGNSIESVYSLFSQESPSGNCMAYTRLAAYMLYLAGIPTVEVINSSHEWCMANIDGQWLIIDATNRIITSDYSGEMYADPALLSFSVDGNIYTLRNKGGIYLVGTHYGPLFESTQTSMTLPDFVDRISPYAFDGCPSEMVLHCSSRLGYDLKKIFSCIIDEGTSLQAKREHCFGEWAYIGNTHMQERICSFCKKREEQEGTYFITSWHENRKNYVDTVGNSFSLEVTSSSSAKIKYLSESPEIATVDQNGKVTLKMAGKAVITMSVEETNYYTASEYQVTVQALDIGTPKITSAKFRREDGATNWYYATITWTKAANVDEYYLCYTHANNHCQCSYRLSTEDGKKTETVTINVSVPPDSSNIFWIKAYNKEHDFTTESNKVYYIDPKIKLSRSSYTYSGTACRPAVSVTSDGCKLKQGQDYILSYSNNTNIGKATVTLKLKGNYRGTASKTFTIVPPKPVLSSVKNKAGKKMKITWKKSKYASGYQIQYSTKKSFSSGNTTLTVSKKSAVTKTIPKLKKAKTYYVRVRVYKTVSGTKYYSGWSNVKKVKITK